LEKSYLLRKKKEPKIIFKSPSEHKPNISVGGDVLLLI